METERSGRGRKTALVLTGGGAKGAFQAAAEQYAREVKGYRWDVIAGVSVGALNGAMLAMQKYDELQQVWTSDLANGQIYTGDLSTWSILKFGLKQLPALLGLHAFPLLNADSRSLLGNRPLWRLIDQHFERGRVSADLRIGAVSLQTGRYHMYRLFNGLVYERRDLPDGHTGDYGAVPVDDHEFKQVILASTAMPVIWPPEDIRVVPPLRGAVDGGLRNINPIGDVLDALDSPEDEVVVISCDPREPASLSEAPRTGVEIAKRSLEIALAEIVRTDVREFERINALVKQAEAAGLTLRNERGRAFTSYNYRIIRPEAPLDDTLDFSREALTRSMKQGQAQAQAVLG